MYLRSTRPRGEAVPVPPHRDTHQEHITHNTISTLTPTTAHNGTHNTSRTCCAILTQPLPLLAARLSSSSCASTSSTSRRHVDLSLFVYLSLTQRERGRESEKEKKESGVASCWLAEEGEWLWLLANVFSIFSPKLQNISNMFLREGLTILGKPPGIYQGKSPAVIADNST